MRPYGLKLAVFGLWISIYLYSLSGWNATPLDHNIKLSMKQEHGKHTDFREYQTHVGKLMKAMLGTRPDLAYANLYLADSAQIFQAFSKAYFPSSSAEENCTSCAGTGEGF